jgi:hypothetical protein
MRKLSLLIAAGIGYVFGTKAGRERYDQIRDAALKVRNDPRVQEKTRQAADLASTHFQKDPFPQGDLP